MRSLFSGVGLLVGLATIGCFEPPLEKTESAGHAKPNVVFIAVDDLNDWVGANGSWGHPQAATPNLDRLIARGVYFSNAHTAAPVCAASRVATLSGLRPATTGFYSNDSRAKDSPQLRKALFLPENFRSSGYETLGGGKIYHLGTDSRLGSREWDEKKTPYAMSEAFREMGHDYAQNFFHPFPPGGSPIVRTYGEVDGYSLCGAPLDKKDIPRGIMPDAELADWAALKLQEKHEKPFFLAVGFARPHVPYTAPREYFERYDPATIQIPSFPKDEMADVPLIGKAMAYGMLPMGDHYTVLDMGPDYWRDLVHAYLACVSFVDDQIGRVVRALDESEYAGNTIVVLWSDHGQHLGEKKHWRKMSLWEESTRVPLVFVLPGDRQGGQVCLRPVSLLDIYPTLVELCELGKIPDLEGTSLTPLLKDASAVRDQPAVTTWYYGNHSVRSESWRYIRYRNGAEELYDHRTDPGEHRNLAGDPRYEAVIDRHRQWIPVAASRDHSNPEGDALQPAIDRWVQKPSLIPAWLH